VSKNKLRDTKVGAWLRDKAPSVLAVVGDALPDRGVLGVVKNLVDKDPTLDSDSFQAVMDAEIQAQEQVTRRWEADAQTDVKLAQYIRPITLVALTLFYMIVTVWDGVDPQFMPPENYINLLEVLMLTVFGAYFAGRTIEKIKR
tara:strand:+ start:211 stop:642 length:432 start_codon:yes stop_codon:yes gene_type:complete